MSIFGNKKWYIWFKGHDTTVPAVLSEIDHRLSKVELLPSADQIVDCETCGCMVRKEKAVRGVSIVRRKYERYEPMIQAMQEQAPSIVLGLDFREEVYTPYYCKRCGEPIKVVGKIKFRRYKNIGGKKK